MAVFLSLSTFSSNPHCSKYNIYEGKTSAKSSETGAGGILEEIPMDNSSWCFPLQSHVYTQMIFPAALPHLPLTCQFLTLSSLPLLVCKLDRK